MFTAEKHNVSHALFFIKILFKNLHFLSINMTKYGGCLLYFGIREQKQILIIQYRFIVFQNIPH